MLTTSVLGTYRVIELAKKYQAAVLFTSSSEVYGTPLEFPQAESYWGNVDPIGFRSPYEEGKRVAEALLLEAGKRFNLDIKIARLFNAYGPGMLPRDSRVIPQFISAALAQKPIKITGEGKQQRTFMYVTDTIAALTVLMEKAPSGSIINVGSEVETAIVDIARKIKSLTQSHSELIFVSRPSHDPSRRVPEITKLKRLGFIPQIDLAAGLAKTIAYFKKYLEEKSALN
jgi:nucleoside-diphosphate-sugar epimerase